MVLFDYDKNLAAVSYMQIWLDVRVPQQARGSRRRQLRRVRDATHDENHLLYTSIDCRRA
jgi:hypothetical protein